MKLLASLQTADRNKFYAAVDGKRSRAEQPAVFLYDGSGTSMADLEAAIPKLL